MVFNTASLKPNGDTGRSMTGNTTGCISVSLVFRVLSGLRRERMVNGMFEDEQPFSSEDFGLVSKGNYWEKS